MRRAARVDGNQAEIDRYDGHGVDTWNNAYRGAGVKTCKNCGTSFHNYNSKAKFCGSECYIKNRTFLVEIPCPQCSRMFKPHTSTVKFCTITCANKSRAKSPKPQRQKRKPHITKCIGCGVRFSSSPSRNRKYCSYQCHIDNGGAQRAGDAAAMAMRKYGAKKDANHNIIFDMIGKLTAVYDLSSAGCGVPDGIAWCGGGWQLFDVKNPNTRYGKRGLNERQKKWANDWRGGPVYLIYTVEEAEQFARGRFDGISRFPEK